MSDIDPSYYPTEEQLEVVRKWHWRDSFVELLKYVRGIWRYDGWTEELLYKPGERKYSISTYGWSGNEDIIRALEGNLMFWSLCWYSSKRGGHYEFLVRTV